MSVFSDIKVLVVEKDPVQQRLVGLLLCQAGMNSFKITDNIEEAEDLLCDQPFNVVLLNNNVRQKDDGKRLIGIMRKIDKNMKVPYILISDDGGQALQQFCKDSEVLFMFKDDLSVKTLKQDIAATLDLWLHHDSPTSGKLSEVYLSSSYLWHNGGRLVQNQPKESTMNRRIPSVGKKIPTRYRPKLEHWLYFATLLGACIAGGVLYATFHR